LVRSREKGKSSGGPVKGLLKKKRAEGRRRLAKWNKERKQRRAGRKDDKG